MVSCINDPGEEVTIGVVGKYVHLRDSYKSLNEALVHGGIANKCRVNLEHFSAEDVERNGAESVFEKIDGLLVPGGFGERGSEGKIEAIRQAKCIDVMIAQHPLQFGVRERSVVITG